ncbi:MULTISPECIES: 50S ribosomal protein L13 [Acidiplasma]|jgi:large subunit ribosomal protein L13|uniref:Large ribosomal subunit protein uL13 n=2 Tax=Acidiplasma TaxID=507753 RepID=A0A0Q0VR10_9ARCH|nr:MULTISPECIES: 50S ribosomal protein L13 [Acidiplasma]KJE49566.1 50S ribosomal protein L13 [Acidiplasma sp. MBA-1]KPV44972.1 50S ribosomal protein L13 [Acidiplasma aeolicum]KQB34058.1 50S ribosomal protein L13 [Acidiplasma aeolicum]KQB36320.1 50S ribosomal protein L13 [Acidiplasma cupricumulans]WMT54162.1 MAG: 50S ribosomal protein L13 [Acidiplasma sp.]
MIYINAENHIYGRLSAYVAKQLLQGEEVTIVNASKVVITGKRSYILDKFNHRRDIGSVRKGPYYPKTPDAILRRAIRGMLPVKTSHGLEAFKRCTVYSNIPKSLQNNDFIKVDRAININATGFITLGEISKILGEVNEQ